MENSFRMIWTNKPHRSENGFRTALWLFFFFLLGLDFSFSYFVSLHASYYPRMIKIDKAMNVSVFFSGAKLLLLGVSC